MGVIIFDFDGTIADSFKLFVDVVHDLAKRTERVSEEDIEKLRGMSFRQSAKTVRFPLWKLPFIMRRGFRMMRSRIGEVKSCEGMPDIIKELHTLGIPLYIMSSNSIENIEFFLESHGLLDAFSKIYGDVSIFGKARMLRKIMRRNQLSRNDVVYVGDEVRDIEGAKHAGVRVIAVGWGYNVPSILKQHHPDVLVDNAQELKAELLKLLQ